MTSSMKAQDLATLLSGFAKQFPSDGNPLLERAVYDQVHKAGTECPGVSYEHVEVARRPAIWVKPEGAKEGRVILFMHGGGYSFGSPNGHRKLTAHLAKACNTLALSIDYRLTPEHPFPAPLHDCVNAYKWLLEQGFKAQHIITAGDSCGGGLATAVPLALRDQGIGLPGAAISLSPWYDMTLSGESMKTNEENDVLNTVAFVNKLADRYTAGEKALRTNPLCSPIFADLKGMPPHWISCGGYDQLLDDGKRVAGKLQEAGVEVVLDVGEGQQHVYEFGVGRMREADESVKKIGDWVKEKVGS
ncbi:Monoterpene epsilon-lactone hydrolase [Fulvia fulva]|nr:Monoterpene epsilon-lactone hydrolase [Fulvia fulva]KAK4633222.1 Monoterpene epsilon-lactone hydrolase [Fulvia fulva]WPV26893.1 Monoterpene epsilon-lactone hydrolase [Fulvia fulva]